MFTIYLVLLVGIVIFPIETRNLNTSPNIRLIPFETILEKWHAGINIFIIEIGGNIAIFIPLGFFVQILFKPLNPFLINNIGKHNLLEIFCIGLILSIVIESIQLLFDIVFKNGYRFFDVDDIILNCIGAVLGYLIFKAVNKVFKK